MVLQKSRPVTAKIKCLNSYDLSDLSNLTMIAKYCQILPMYFMYYFVNIFTSIQAMIPEAFFPLMESLDSHPFGIAQFQDVSRILSSTSSTSLGANLDPLISHTPS